MIIKVKKIIKFIINKIGYDVVRLMVEGEPEVAITDSQTENKIHYGCGAIYLKDWLNVDLNLRSKEGYVTASVNLVKRHPFKNDSFKFGFAEDFMEHLDQADQIIFLCEVYRTLQKGGVLRLSFPGLEGVLNIHYNEPSYETAKLAKREAYEMWRHKHFLSYEELSLICQNIGYRSIRRVKFGESEYSELYKLDTRHEQIGLNTYVEIVK